MHSKVIKLILVKGISLSFLISSVAQTTGQNLSISIADSFYTVKDWKNAKMAYEKTLTDTSTSSLEWNRLGYANFNLGYYDQALNDYVKAVANNPAAPLKPVLYSRMAMVYAIKKDRINALGNLEKATGAGYLNFVEMDTARAFTGLREDEKFKALRNKAYATAYPCTADPKQRAFDFWIGEWDAYVTGTKNLAGYSVIQSASGGCMILENWTSANLPYTGKSINFIEAATGKWKQVWVGAEGGGEHVFSNGEYRDSAMYFDFEQTANGKKQKGRFTFF